MPVGIYLHIPFCKSRCSYCDFATDVYKNDSIVESYVSALISEISNFSNHSDSRKLPANTIYFGGGTPSLLSPLQLENILKVIHEKFDVQEGSELTLEMNPATVSLENLLDFKSLGINRASFGVQTFNERALNLLARGHDANDARNTFDLLRQAQFENVSFDLIAGLPNQSLDDWQENLNEALALDPEHLSLYLLEIHEGTPLSEQIRSKRQPSPDEELAGKMYELMPRKVAAKGFAHYEISNFAKPGFESSHNNKYWLCEAVFGFGVSAHSFDGNSLRWSNERDTNQYVSRINNGESPIVEKDPMTKKQLAKEFAFLNLRLSKGLNFSEFNKKFGYDLRNEFAEDLSQCEKLGLIEVDENRLKLTPKGFLYSNEVFAVFV